MQEVALHADPGQETLQMPELFRGLTDAIWSELPAGAKKPDPKAKVAISTMRRTLQREYTTRLTRMVLGPPHDFFSFFELLFYGYQRPVPADARALARQHLAEIDNRVNVGLAQDIDAMSKAHLQELHDKIDKVLKASCQVNEP
jgi:hypothetical protein